MDDRFYIKQAIKRAKKAALLGEVPVGAVIVKDGVIISSGYNLREKKNNALLHAEIIAIDRACKRLGVWRLEDCTLYVTLEPCPMCAGAIINSRIKRVVFGGYDQKAGVYGSVFNISDFAFNHRYEVTGGVLKDECAALLSDFFAQLRINKRGF
ncbi:MAG: tRNA-specific adenosine deaminase [Firmicutes bacterium HGW-Firmicutes-21]|nr:MAG: tRNA-specific adenosine deaminase [Firmicutes bacterium HGW-Firmicutes-21]